MLLCFGNFKQQKGKKKNTEKESVPHSHPPHKRWWEKSSFCTHCDDDACNLQHKHKHKHKHHFLLLLLLLFSLFYHSLYFLFLSQPWFASCSHSLEGTHEYESCCEHGEREEVRLLGCPQTRR